MIKYAGLCSLCLFMFLAASLVAFLAYSELTLLNHGFLLFDDDKSMSIGRYTSVTLTNDIPCFHLSHNIPVPSYLEGITEGVFMLIYDYEPNNLKD